MSARRTIEGLESIFRNLLASHGRRAAVQAVYDLGMRDAGGGEGRRPTRRHANYVERAREVAAPILAGVRARHAGENGPTARAEAMYALSLAGLRAPAIATALSISHAVEVRRELARFQPTAEQEWALRAIAGVEAVRPQLSAVA